MHNTEPWQKIKNGDEFLNEAIRYPVLL